RVIDRIVPPLDRVGLLEPVLDVRLNVAVILRRDVERLAVEFFPDLTLFDNDVAALDDVARELKHGLLIWVWRINCDISIGPRAEVAFVRESEDPGRSSPGDDGDL